MKKILIMGNGGAGKSTLARKLSEITGIPVYHLDTLYWNPGWVPTQDKEWYAKVNELLVLNEWIMDGNYSNTLDARIEAADTIIYMNTPLILCLYRIVKRRIMYHGKSRPDMHEGCYEKLDWEFVSWVLRYNKKKPQILMRLKNIKGKNVVIINSRAQGEMYTEGIKKDITNESL